MSTISQLQPTNVWQYFAQLCELPRPSKHEQLVVSWIQRFAEDKGFECELDDIGNVIVRKPASAGCEGYRTVILQSHIDMVPQKNAGTVHDFKTDPIKPYIDGEWVTAEGTTLGADNGMGVAAMMAVLDSTNIKHGPIEALFTIDEEAGMTGALNLDPKILKGDLLFNLDTEDDGELYVGCAGGQDINIEFDYEAEQPAHGSVAWQLAISGLLGGHSGLDINTGRANANKLMNRLLRRLLAAGIELQLADIKGGSLRNAIARESFATIMIPAEQQDDLLVVVEDVLCDIEDEFGSAEPNLAITATPASDASEVLPLTLLLRFIRAMDAVPHGVERMSVDLPGIVETSNNVGVIRMKNGKLRVRCLVRSLSDKARDEFSESVAGAFILAGASVSFDNPYPGWTPNPESKLLHGMKVVHKELFGFEPAVKVIHAGLECGILGAIYPNWDMISFGPTIRGAHSPDERVEVATVERFWQLLVASLEQIPQP